MAEALGLAWVASASARSTLICFQFEWRERRKRARGQASAVQPNALNPLLGLQQPRAIWRRR